MHLPLTNYSIQREIGSGGMAVVYEAIDKKLHRTVALKMLHPHLINDPEAAARFKREALAAAKMDHPHIVRVYEYVRERDVHGIVMEYVPGTDMESAQKKIAKLDCGTVVAVMGEIADALAEAHRQGIIHRDLKPSNILIHRQGRAMLTDFGLAHNALESRLTQGNVVVGTPVYMSPEQISGKDLTPASDVYSWAVTFYFLLTGALPYASQGFPAIAGEIQRGAVVCDNEKLGALPECYRALLAKCFFAAPAERIESGITLKRIFDECIKKHPLAADIRRLLNNQPHTESSERRDLSKTNLFFPASRSDKKLLFTGAAVLALICAVTIAFYATNQKKKPIPLPSVPPQAVSQAPRPAAAVHTERSPSAVAYTVSEADRVQKPIQTERRVPESEPARLDSGQLFIYCTPWATVYINGRDAGNTPFEKPVALPVGTYALRLYNKHCATREDTIAITARTILRKRYTLSRLP